MKDKKSEDIISEFKRKIENRAKLISKIQKR